MERSMNDSNTMKNVLIVDDDDLLRETTGMILEGLGYNVIEASDGLIALSKLNTSIKIDLLITDIEMPNLNGVELLRTLSNIDEINYKIIVVSGLDISKVPDDWSSTINIIGDKFLSKPYTEDDLISCISSLK